MDTDGEKKLKIVFEPGAFDDFEGTQEELDQLIAELTRMAESGELFEKGIPISELDDETLEGIERDMNQRGTRKIN